MNNSLGLLLSDHPVSIVPGLNLYQPTVRDVVEIGEEQYNIYLKIWSLPRAKMIQQETEYTKNRNDLEIWFEYINMLPQLKNAVEESALIFFHKKIEFFPLSNTMYIGEASTGLLLDLNLYLTIRALFTKLDYSKSDDKDKQYEDSNPKSERERQMLENMKKAQAKLNTIKYGDNGGEDALGKQIVALVAIGKYTFEQVYNMTMLQFTMLLRKYLDIERYEMHTILSPYISSKDSNSQENKHWLM